MHWWLLLWNSAWIIWVHWNGHWFRQGSKVQSETMLLCDFFKMWPSEITQTEMIDSAISVSQAIHDENLCRKTWERPVKSAIKCIPRYLQVVNRAKWCEWNIVNYSPHLKQTPGTLIIQHYRVLTAQPCTVHGSLWTMNDTRECLYFVN